MRRCILEVNPEGLVCDNQQYARLPVQNQGTNTH